MIEWFDQELGWMYWNWAGAAFFGFLFLSIAGLTVWDVVSPGTSRRGFLPVATTRGDRLFLGIMTTIGWFLIWVALVGNEALWVAAGVACVWNAVLAKWG